MKLNMIFCLSQEQNDKIKGHLNWIGTPL